MNLVIFDCDGTIVDSQHMIVAAMDRAFLDNGLATLPRAETLSIVGLSLSHAIGRLLPHADEAEIERVATSYRQAFFELRQDPVHHEPPYPDALEVIRALAARPDTLVGIATGKSRRGVDAILQRLELTDVFATIQTADGHPSKPHPSMLRAAIAETGATPARTVMIGDTTFDIEMASSAGVAAIGVAWGYHPADHLVRAGAEAIVNAYDEVPTAVDRLLAAVSRT